MTIFQFHAKRQAILSDFETRMAHAGVTSTARRAIDLELRDALRALDAEYAASRGGF